MVIQTFSGRMVDLTNFSRNDVCIDDIAASLSKLCRFNGHTKRHYSVAQHCLEAVELAESFSLSPEVQFAVLMHDAGEAYIGDMPSPIKRMMPQFQELEDKIQAVIVETFAIDTSPETLAIVKSIDEVMLATERRDLLWHHRPWPMLTVEPRIKPIIKGSDVDWLAAFEAKYYQLNHKRRYCEAPITASSARQALACMAVENGALADDVEDYIERLEKQLQYDPDSITCIVKMSKTAIKDARTMGLLDTMISESVAVATKMLKQQIE